MNCVGDDSQVERKSRDLYSEPRNRFPLDLKRDGFYNDLMERTAERDDDDDFNEGDDDDDDFNNRDDDDDDADLRDDDDFDQRDDDDDLFDERADYNDDDGYGSSR